jgi:hypothetical protein
MDRQKKRRVSPLLVAVAVAVGAGAGSYGIAAAASGSGSSSSSSNAALIPLAAGDGSGPPRNGGNPWGRQRSDETLLTGDTKASVREAALSKVPNGTIVRIETDADGHAAYEAHMTKADGTPVTVYVDKQFNVVGVESR